MSLYKRITENRAGLDAIAHHGRDAAAVVTVGDAAYCTLLRLTKDEGDLSQVHKRGGTDRATRGFIP